VGASVPLAADACCLQALQGTGTTTAQDVPNTSGIESVRNVRKRDVRARHRASLLAGPTGFGEPRRLRETTREDRIG
jgi:hypothetical protein